MKRFIRQNSLTLFFLMVFLVTVAAQSQASSSFAILVGYLGIEWHRPTRT